MYTNNRYVTLDLYGVDADAMQVWISNDGENGTVVDFAYGKTITITNQNYSVGTSLTTSNSTSSTNSNNVLRIVNWPLSSVNGTKKIYAVFRDAYGNKTSTSGLSTINISFNLNGISTTTTPVSISTVKNLAVYLPSITSSAVNKSFSGWSTTSGATLPTYQGSTLASFSSNTTLYAIGKTVNVGDYLYYNLDSTKKYELLNSISGSGSSQIFNIANKFSNLKQIFKVISSSNTSISISPMQRSQVFSATIRGIKYTNIGTITNTICGLYASNYSSSTAVISDSLMQAVATDSDFASLFAEYGFNGQTRVWHDDNTGCDYYYVNLSKIGSYNNSVRLSDEVQYVNESVSAYVYPVITLKNTVKFSGIGSSTSPYTLSMP